VTEPAPAAPRRAAALLLSGAPAAGGCPPGVAADTFARALAEDVADLITELPGLDAAVGFTPEHQAVAAAVTWPGTTLVPLPPGGGALPLLAALHGLGYHEGAVVSPDVPDLPGLLVAKVFSGLAGALVAVVPALPAGRLDLPALARVGTGATGATGVAGPPTDGLAVLGCRLPAPAWLRPEVADLDAADAVERLRSAAPRRRDLVVAPVWRRLRAPTDLAGLDPGLEGWEATRALLSGR
jgi:hypothetical protein